MSGADDVDPPKDANFPIYDPFGIREVVQPVVGISKIENVIHGIGTCFQISPWRWLTAHHVVRHSDAETFPPDTVGAVGFSHGYVYGRVGFRTTDFFGEVHEVLSFKQNAPASPTILGQPKKSPIVIDACSLRVDVSRLKYNRLVSPLPLSRTPPACGDEVLAIGFPIVGAKCHVEKDPMLFEEELHGAPGIVVQTSPAGESKRWPSFVIEGNWASGMSGGPVINKQGEVVGLVSTSIAPTPEKPGIGLAVSLAEVPMKGIAPELDLERPGWVFGFGVLTGGNVAGFFPNEQLAKTYRDQLGKGEVQYMHLNPKTEDYMAL